MYLCYVCRAVRYFVLLFLVQRHRSVFVQVWVETRIVDTIFHEKKAYCFAKTDSSQGTDEQRSHNQTGEPLYVKPNVTLARVPGFEWVVLREDCLAHRTPLQINGDAGPMYIRKFRTLPFFSASA